MIQNVQNKVKNTFLTMPSYFKQIIICNYEVHSLIPQIETLTIQKPKLLLCQVIYKLDAKKKTLKNLYWRV